MHFPAPTTQDQARSLADRRPQRVTGTHDKKGYKVCGPSRVALLVFQGGEPSWRIRPQTGVSQGSSDIRTYRRRSFIIFP